MNILNIQLPKNHFHTLLHLAQNKEHNVYSNWHGSTSYENACGIYTLTPEDNSYIKGKQENVIGYIEKFIDYVNNHADVWLCRRIDIAHHWYKHHQPVN